MTIPQYTLKSNPDTTISLHKDNIQILHKSSLFTLTDIPTKNLALSHDTSSFIINQELVIVCRFCFIICNLKDNSAYYSPFYSFQTPRIVVSFYASLQGIYLDPNIDFFSNCLYLVKHNVPTPILFEKAESNKLTMKCGSISLYYFIEHDRWIYDEPKDNLNIPLEMWPRLHQKSCFLAQQIMNSSIEIYDMKRADLIKQLCYEADTVSNAMICGALLAALKSRGIAPKIKSKQLPSIALCYYLSASKLLGRKSRYYFDNDFAVFIENSNLFSILPKIQEIVSKINLNKFVN